MRKTKILMREQIVKKYEKLSWKEKVIILEYSLEYMQKYNGRSKLDCIVAAMGDEYNIEEIINEQAD